VPARRVAEAQSRGRQSSVRGRDGGVRQELAAGMIRKHRTYLPRIVGDKVMMPADLKRLHKYMLDVEHIGIISDEMREVVEELWPELAHKLPPKRQQG
jgi:N-glycosylase/DNA lyase